MHIEIIKRCALGNGTRQVGERLCSLVCESVDSVKAAALQTYSHALDELPANIDLADGVEPIEVLTALRNDDTIRLVLDEVEEAAEVVVDEVKEAAVDVGQIVREAVEELPPQPAEEIPAEEIPVPAKRKRRR